MNENKRSSAHYVRFVSALVLSATTGCASVVGDSDAASNADSVVVSTDTAVSTDGTVASNCANPGPQGALCAGPMNCGPPGCGAWECRSVNPDGGAPYQWMQLLCGGPQLPPELV